MEKRNYREPRRKNLKLYIDRLERVLKAFPNNSDLGLFFRCYLEYDIYGKEPMIKDNPVAAFVVGEWCDHSDVMLGEYQKTCDKNQENALKGIEKAKLISEFRITKFDEENGQHLFESMEDQVMFMEAYERGDLPEWIKYDYEFYHFNS